MNTKCCWIVVSETSSPITFSSVIYEVKCILFSPAILTKIFVVSGYIASEYLYKGEISTKSDIYSLGVIIIEMLIGKKCYLAYPDVDNV